MKKFVALTIAVSAFAGLSQAATVTELVDTFANLCPELPSVINSNAAVLQTILGAAGDYEIIDPIPDLEGKIITIYAFTDPAVLTMLANVQALGLGGIGEKFEEAQVIPLLKSHIAIDGTTLNGDTVDMDMNRDEVTIASTTANIADGPLPESCSGSVEVYSIDNVILPSNAFDLYFTPVVQPTPAPLVVPSSSTTNSPLSMKDLFDFAGSKCPELIDLISEDAPVLNTALIIVGKDVVLDNTPNLEGKIVTIFAPTDASFLAAKLGFKIDDADPQQLMDLIKRHIAVSGDKDATAVVSLTGETVIIDDDNKKVNGPFNSANILAAPLPEACVDSNVVVYSIDGVLLPEEEYADAGPLIVESSSSVTRAAGAGSIAAIVVIVVAAFA